MHGDQHAIMSDRYSFDAAEHLHWTAALSWAADCVEHLADQAGDTPKRDVAGCVALARSYAQTRQFDTDQARELASSVKSARRKLAWSGAGTLSTVLDTLVGGALLELRQSQGRDTIFDPAVDWGTDRGAAGESDYVRRERQLKGQLKTVLQAAEKLCDVDARAAARDAPGCCRAANPSEAEWQFDRLLTYTKQAGSNPAQADAQPSPAGSQPS